MPSRTIELDLDVMEKLEAAKISPQESFSSVVRRAQFPPKPHMAHELLEEFGRRAGYSPLTDDDLERLAEVQQVPKISTSHWSQG